MVKEKKISICLFTAFTFLYLFSASIDAPMLGDNKSLFDVSQRIVEHGFKPIPGKNTAETYSVFGLGQSIINLPVVWAYIVGSRSSGASMVVYTLIISLLSAVIAALINILFFQISLQLGYRVKTSMLMTLVLGLTTMIWVYSQGLYSDLSLGLLWLLAFYSVLLFKRTGRSLYLFIAGSAAGFSFITKIAALYTVPVFLCWVMYLVAAGIREKKMQNHFRPVNYIIVNMAMFIVPVLVFLWIMFWYNHIRYNCYICSGYEWGRNFELGFDSPFLTGFYGLVFSTGKGIFFYNPSIVLAFLGFGIFFRKHKTESLVILAIITGQVLICSKWWAWHGDWSWGPRLLCPLIPFVLLFIIPWFEQFMDKVRQHEIRSTVTLSVLSVLLIVSFLIQIPGICIGAGHYILVVANETGFFEHPMYDKESWPIRDDALQIHFIPEFNPVQGHLWMMRCIYNRNTPELREIFQSPPWKNLNSKWIPGKYVASHFYYNVWWLFAIQYQLPHYEILVTAAFIMVLTSICAFILAFHFSRQGK